MSKSIAAILGISLIVLATGSFAGPQQRSRFDCPGPGGPLHNHHRMLEHAVLAEVAYKAAGTYSSVDLNKYCPAGTPPRRVDITVLEVPKQIIDLAIAKLEEEETTVKFYTDSKSGERVIVCNPDEGVGQRLAIGLRYVVGNGRLSLIPRIVLAGTLILTGREELRVIELRQEGNRNQSQSDQGGKIFGVQGTDIFRHRQLGAAVRALKDGSRCFDFALEISENFFDSCNPDFRALLRYDIATANDISVSHTIVGHSLGGAVAQYVAQKRDFSNIITECGRKSTFQAYSFNSFGVSSANTVASGTGKTFSVRIAGELLEKPEADLGRRQTGHVYRYAVPPPSPNFIAQFNRHKIRRVQKEICRCWDSKQDSTNLAYEYAEP